MPFPIDFIVFKYFNLRRIAVAIRTRSVTVHQVPGQSASHDRRFPENGPYRRLVADRAQVGQVGGKGAEAALRRRDAARSPWQRRRAVLLARRPVTHLPPHPAESPQAGPGSMLQCWPGTGLSAEKLGLIGLGDACPGNNWP
ncbi:unnamed protein product [Angiostrongylus costaricensis]|uniref:Pyr_redox_2 domain-containing protein n=1 Tax=Angiostrongylus costaricensis TaxID=334426 RepID=A0A0R3PUT5_ANGCS|nr:unnamed protein product [Angiostrongylus costaricensis]